MAWGQTELTVSLSISDKVTKTDGFRFSILTQNDTISVFNSVLNPGFNKNKVKIPRDQGTFTGLFEYREKNNKWEAVEYKFHSDTSGLKRIEIGLYFSINDHQTEFLQDFTIDKYYQNHSVSIQSGKLKVGAQPVFILVSHSDTTFYGASSTNHFYGTIKTKTTDGWYDFAGSYCRSTVPGKPLSKLDTVYSWVPNYHPGGEYKIKRPGTYQYVVPMVMENYSDGIPVKMIDDGETRRRTRMFFEVETEFEVERKSKWSCYWLNGGGL